MSNLVSGICFLKLDGEMLDIEGTLSISGQMRTREAVVSTTGVIGYSETPKAPSITVTAFLGKNFPRERIENATDLTVTAECANGEVFTLSQAFVSGEFEVDANAGTTSITFTGVRGEWQ